MLSRVVSRKLYAILGWKSHEAGRIFREANMRLSAGGISEAELFEWMQAEWLKVQAREGTIARDWDEVENIVMKGTEDDFVEWRRKKYEGKAGGRVFDEVSRADYREYKKEALHGA
jgi:hypothetical protein